MAKNWDKEYKCPYCFQTSSRKYNINIHIQRKHHHPYPQINNTNQSPTFNEPPNFIDFEKSLPSNWDRSMEQPSSSPFFIPPTFPFYPNSFFYDVKVKDDENERESRRRFNKTLWEYMKKIVIPSLKFQNTQFNYSESIHNIPIFTDPKNWPKAHKIYKCHKCFMQTLKPFFDFQEIHPANKFIHFCYANQEQQQKHKDNNNPQIKTLNLQEILLSVIDSRLKLENKLLKMIVFPDTIVKNALSLKILTFLMDLVGNEEDYPLRWLFELLENEGFVDLGEINSQHWAKRAYDDCYLEEKYITKLEKEELKEFVNMTEGTFGLIKFKINNNKTIYTFSYLLPDNEKTIENSIIRFNK